MAAVAAAVAEAEDAVADGLDLGLAASLVVDWCFSYLAITKSPVHYVSEKRKI